MAVQYTCIMIQMEACDNDTELLLVELPPMAVQYTCIMIQMEACDNDTELPLVEVLVM